MQESCLTVLQLIIMQFRVHVECLHIVNDFLEEKSLAFVMAFKNIPFCIEIFQFKRTPSIQCYTTFSLFRSKFVVTYEPHDINSAYCCAYCSQMTYFVTINYNSKHRNFSHKTALIPCFFNLHQDNITKFVRCF